MGLNVCAKQPHSVKVYAFPLICRPMSFGFVPFDVHYMSTNIKTILSFYAAVLTKFLQILSLFCSENDESPCSFLMILSHWSSVSAPSYEIEAIGDSSLDAQGKHLAI